MGSRDEFGLLVGSNVARAAALAARPGGVSMGEIVNATGDTQYNVFKRLEMRGHFVRRQGAGNAMRIWLQHMDQANRLAPSFNRTTAEKIMDQQLGVLDEPRDTQSFRSLPSRPVIRVPAARVRQGELVLYTMSLKVRDLIAPGFYSVETLDPSDADDKGYQRLLNHSRAKRLADYIVKGQDESDAFLPTSVFLATDKTLAFDPERNTLDIDLEHVGAFSVVDGQHRLEGLRLAVERDARVLDFEMPVNIAVNLPKIAQMCHFLIVNTTQKSVDKSVEQRIIARLTEALDIEDMPSLPRWILRTVEKGEVDKAVKYVDYLNETEESPWFGKIRMANAETAGGTINQRSFVKSIVKYVLTANNPLTVVKDFEKEKRIFLNYWKAIHNVLDDGDSETLYKYGGVELFCKFSITFFMKLQERGSFTVPTMENLLRSCFENVEGEYTGVGHPEWWTTGGEAGRLNSGALNLVSQEMAKALHKASMSGSIEL